MRLIAALLAGAMLLLPATAQAPTIVDEAELDAALQLFEDHGLQMPTGVTVSYDCETDRTIHGSYSSGLNLICLWDNSVLVHELAHAWEHQYMTDKARDAFAERLGLDDWNTTGLVWSDRPWERVAEVIEWKLTRDTQNVIYEEFFQIITERPAD